MITKDGWFDWAIRLPGRPEKVNGWRNGLLGLAGHSAEGWRRYLLEYQTDPQYAARKASWHASNLLTGEFYQHYPVQAQTWTSGASFPNDNFFGLETEGKAGMPLNDAQSANVARVLSDLADYTGRRQIERIGTRTGVPAGVLAIIEHTEATRWGALPTSCPSGRYDWNRIIREASQGGGVEEDEMKIHDGWGLVGFEVPGGEVAEIDARKEFGVPPEAKRVHLEILSSRGYVVILHGPTKTHAGRVGWARSRDIADGYEHCDVFLDAQGRFYLFAEDKANPPHFYNAHVTMWG